MSYDKQTVERMESGHGFAEGTVLLDGKDGYHRWAHFPSVDVFTRLKASETNRLGSEKACQRIFSERGEGSPTAWEGSLPSIKAYRDKLQTGWKDGLEKMQERLKVLHPPAAKDIRRRRIRSDVGDTLDIHRVYAGRFDVAWERRKRQASPGRRVVRILCALAAASYVRPEQLFWRGAVAVILARALEKAGYRVEIVAFEVNKACFDGDGDKTYAWTVTIKRADQSMSLERLALLLAHPSTLRTMMFGARNSHPVRVRHHYGFPVHERPKFALENDIVIDDIWSETQAQIALDSLTKRFR